MARAHHIVPETRSARACSGDQLLRKDMSDAQREQLSAILDDIYEGFTEGIAQSRGKTAQEVRPSN